MPEAAARLPSSASQMRIIERASLRGLNTFGIEAQAARLIEVHRTDELAPALAACGPGGPGLVLGGGSNLILCRDPAGSVLRLATRGRRIRAERADTVIVEAAAGEVWSDLVTWTLDQGLSGLENLSLIPGSVGAAPIQNIGAYGVELAEHFDSLTAIHRLSGETRDFDRAECAFGYRESFFKQPEGASWIVTELRLRLQRAGPLRLDYGEIREALRTAGILEPGPREVSEVVSAIRRRKLPDPAISGNAGSFFKNPLVPVAQAAALQACHADLPAHAQADGLHCKLPAGWLIERCGWKGHRDPTVGVHPQHALVLINLGGATGTAVLDLAARIRDSVMARFGVRLSIEPAVV